MRCVGIMPQISMADIVVFVIRMRKSDRDMEREREEKTRANIVINCIRIYMHYCYYHYNHINPLYMCVHRV